MAVASAPRNKVKLIRRTAGGTRLIEVEVLAHEAGLHPDLVRRLLRLGVIDAAGGTAGAPLFPRDAAARLARTMRLRQDLGLNYAGAILATQLLARIEELEDRLRRYEQQSNRTGES
jgi:hypothetical protein